MKRKLIKQGGGAGLTVYLPKRWIDEKSLQGGDEVDIEIVHNNLVISKEQGGNILETEIDLSHMSDYSIRTLMTNTYRKGFDKVKIIFKNQSQMKIVEKTIKRELMGFDIVKKDDNNCIVESITEPSADQFEIILRKILYNISELFDITIRRMDGEELDYEEIEEKIYSYYNFCQRVVSKKKLVLPNSEFIWNFLVLTVHGQRELYHLNKIINKKTISEETKDYLKDASQVFTLLKEAYMKKEIESLSKIHELEKELILEKGYKLLEKGTDNQMMYRIMTSIRGFNQATSPLIGVLL